MVPFITPEIAKAGEEARERHLATIRSRPQSGDKGRYAMLDQIDGMMQKSRSGRDPVRDAAHFLLCFNYQGFAKIDPPMIDGACQWRVWHLNSDARKMMNSAEQSLYDALMGDFTTAA